VPKAEINSPLFLVDTICTRSIIPGKITKLYTIIQYIFTDLFGIDLELTIIKENQRFWKELP
jgi:hypothetical protein